MDTRKELYTCSGFNIPVTNTTVSEEYIVKQRQVMNETELVELREQKTVKNVLKSSSWGLLAAAVREKHFRIMQEMKTEKAYSKASSNCRYVGWEGLKLEKESDRGKVGRIVTGQREELDALRNMHLVQKSLRDEEMVKSKASKLFGLTPSKPSIYVKKHSNTVLVTKYPRKHPENNTFEKSVRANSQAFVGTVFSVPSKSKRVLERLTSRQLDNIADAEKKLRKQATYNYRFSQVTKGKHRSKSHGDEQSTTDSSDVEMSGKHQSGHNYLQKRKSDRLTGHHLLDEGKHHRTKNHIHSNDLFIPNVSPDEQLSDDTLGNLSDADTACTLTDNEMPPSLHGATSSVTAESPLVISHHHQEEMAQFSSYVMENGKELEMTSKDEHDEGEMEVVETTEEQSTTTTLTSRTQSVQTDSHSVSDSSQSSFDWSSSEASSQRSSYVSQTSRSSISHTSFECDDHELDNDNVPITEEEEDNKTLTVRPSITSEPVLTSTFFPENLSESQQSIINHMINDDELPTLPPLTTGSSQPTVNNNRNSWSWLDSYRSRFTRTVSEESAESAYSSVDVRYSIDSPQISDSAFNTPAHDLSSPFSEHGPKQQGSHNTRHPLGRDIDKRRGRSSTEDDGPPHLKRSTKSSLPQSAFDNPGFVEFCKNLDHSPTIDDYAVYKILSMSEDIEEKYGKKIESAIQEAFVFALKNKLSYFNFAKISHRLALQASYVQEQAFLITCLGRRMLEKLPELEEVISTYTTQAVEEMAAEFMLGLHLSGDTHNPEMGWDYDDWSELLQGRGPESDINKVLNENTVSPEIVFSDFPYQLSNHSTSDNSPPITPPPSNEPVNNLTLPTIRRVSSVEVLIADNTNLNQSDQTKLVVPNEVLQRRRSWSSPLSPFSCLPLPSTDHMIKTTDHMTKTIDQMTDTAIHDTTTEMSEQALPKDHVTDPDIDIEDTVFEAKTTEQVSLHLEESRNNRLSSKPIVLSLSSQQSNTSVVSGRFIRTIRGMSTSSSLSSYTPEFTESKDWTYSNYDNDLSLLEVEEEVEMRITTENLTPSQSDSNTQPESIELPAHADNEQVNDPAKRKKGRRPESIELSGPTHADNGQVNDPAKRIEGRRRSSLQVISDAMTSPVITIGLPLVVLAAIALGRS